MQGRSQNHIYHISIIWVPVNHAFDRGYVGLMINIYQYYLLLLLLRSRSLVRSNRLYTLYQFLFIIVNCYVWRKNRK